jgi:hypothetical protein
MDLLDNSRTPVYLTYTGELVIEAPHAHVWPIMLDYTTWQNYPTAKNLEGEPGSEGELVLLEKVEGDYESPPYFARTYVLDPATSRVGWKIWPAEKGEFLGAEDFVGIVEFRLRDEGSRSVYWYNTIYEFVVSGKDPAEVARYRRDLFDTFDTVLASVRQHLKELCEA